MAAERALVVGGRRTSLRTARIEDRSAPRSVRLWPASASRPVEWAIGTDDELDDDQTGFMVSPT